MVATKTNERPGTRAQLRYARMPARKARAVLDLIRGLPVDRADEVLEFSTRAPARPIRKLLASAVANAENNDHQDGDSLYISTCYADEGPTLRRWRPRARGRATRIRKRTCHITIIVGPMPPEMVERVEAERSRATAAAGATGGRRAQEARRARVARSRAAQGQPEPDDLEGEELEPDDDVDELEELEELDQEELDQDERDELEQLDEDTGDEDTGEDDAPEEGDDR
jgi:large subunit ribosomal protein L22